MSLVNENLTTQAQDFTAGWVDLGGEIPTETFKALGLWLIVDINDTLDARFRVLAKHTSGGADEYVLPIKTETATVVNIEDEYCEFQTDEDAKRVFSFALDEIIPFVQVQIQAGTAGETEGQILSSKYTLI